MSEQKPSNGAATVVVVNDDPVQLRMMAELLRKTGLAPQPYVNSAEALEALRHERPPDLLVVDLHMPEIDGWRFCRLLRSDQYPEYNETPILVVSATYSGEDARGITAETGADAFLPAPIKPAALREQVRLLLSGETPRHETHVLIVDDEPVICELLERAFDQHGDTARVATTAAEAQAMLEEQAPDIVVLDYLLPDKTGDQLLQAFREANPLVVIIMITSDPKPERAIDWLRRGASAYVRKPFDVNYLLALCDHAQRERSLLHVEELLEERTRELRASEARYRQIYSESPDMLLSLDEDGSIVDVNKKWLEVTGYAREEVVGRRADFVMTPEAAERFLGEDLPRIWREGKADALNYFYRTKQGDEREVVLDGVVMRTPGGEQSVLAILRDVTQLREAEEQLRQADKMKAVGQLAGGVAHDFNNLLQVIQGYADLARELTAPEHPVYPSLGHIMHASERAAVLVHQLLTFSQREPIQPIFLDLNEFLDGRASGLAEIGGEAVNIQFHRAPDLPAIYADVQQLEQVLVNLCHNAADAMEEGGTITIGTANVTLDEAQCKGRPWATPGEYVVLTVSDTGPGIPREIRDRIFEPFFTTKEVGQGPGLGLANVYAVVKRHDGLVDVRSEPGQGTTFRLCLPAMGESTELTRQRAKPQQRASDATILLAEDDELIRDLAIQVLTEAGYEVLVARDGKEALDLFRRHTDEVGLAVLDVVMPLMTGRVAAERMIEIRPDLPILFCTGYDPPQEPARLPISGAQLLQKPYRPADLRARVRTMLGDAS